MAKVSKAEADYEARSLKPYQCGNCKMFIAPSNCTAVAGTIAKAGVCKLFEPTKPLSKVLTG